MPDDATRRDTHRMPAQMCPACGYLTDAAGEISGKATAAPGKGDITMCLACGAVSQYDGFLNLVRCDPAELRDLELRQPETYAKLRQAQQFVRGKESWAPRDRRGGRA